MVTFGEDTIIISTGKSRQKREAIIPRYDALNEVLARIPKRSPVILTSTKKAPWKQNGLNTMFWRAKERNGMLERDLHFHDLRGTAATNFYNSGLYARIIAEIMAWEEYTVEKIIRRHMGRNSATKEMIKQLNQSRLTS
jgi:integrase